MPPRGHQGAPGPRSRAKLPEQEKRTGPAAAWGGHPASFTPRGAGTPLGAWALRYPVLPSKSPFFTYQPEEF